MPRLSRLASGVWRLGSRRGESSNPAVAGQASKLQRNSKFQTSTIVAPRPVALGRINGHFQSFFGAIPKVIPNDPKGFSKQFQTFPNDSNDFQPIPTTF